MRTRSTVVIVIALTAAAVIGGGAYVVARVTDEPFRNSPEASRTLEQIDPARENGLAGAALEVEQPAPSAPASSPEEAVSGLLDALIAGDAERSFSLLSEGDRSTLGPLATWRDRLTSLPRPLGYEVLGVDADEVTTQLTLEPRLDEVIGFVPGQARAAWTTVDEDGGYRVAYADSTTEPTLPGDDAASSAAESWVAERQQCREGMTYGGNLLGQPTLADALCRTEGRFEAGPAEALERFRDPTLLLNAFGADAATFVRVVPIDGPVAFQVALAPFGDRWEVIGLVQR